MKAIIRLKAGKEFSTMKIQNIEIPQTQSGELKVKMISSRINPVDMDLMKGFPSLKYKNPQIGGIDGAGIILEIGKGVTNFAIGDKVLFYRMFSDIGTWAEEITIPANYCAKIPNNIDTKEAGAIALPLLTAYDSLQQLNAKKGEKILIHGIGGGVGFQALQIAKQMGLYVIGTGSQSDKHDLEKAGIDQFIDYKTQDFSQVLKTKEVDYIFDTLGDDILKKSIALQPKKIVSVKYVDTSQMHKAGVNLPGIMKWLMKMMMGKFTKLAKKNSVQLIGQVTGANGKFLQQAIDLIQNSFVSRKYNYVDFSTIEKDGLSKKSIGKIIQF
ncbi:alcohol dehydrogenase catalytic domain-containing protein [Flavobacterium sp.]|jgi:NADPH:quinone reductase-like Zn-dependent oxidoreductase|uniref:alcohol dehydrogenase catalytic domain-containing protein n=1 Tax=Flavobacterium sp. TaxID=239 RepID=UPI0037C11E93